MCVTSQQSGWRFVRNYKLIPAKCVWKTSCVGKLSTEISTQEKMSYLCFCSLGQTTTQTTWPWDTENCIFPVVLLLAGDFGARNVPALSQGSSVYKIKFTSCPCGTLRWGNTKWYLTPQHVRLPSSAQLVEARSLLTRGFPWLNF